MDEVAAQLRRRWASGWLVALFFVSGSTGLVYQTVWSRQLHHVFGTSTLAIATVLAAFMGGLTVGGALASRWTGHVARPLRVYGWLEIGIGLFAWAFPWLLTASEPLWQAIWWALPGAPLGRAAAQLLLVGGLLLLPTAAMGATLPVLVRHAAEGVGMTGRVVGRLYAANTAGAVAGTALAGFWMLPALGLAATTSAAALANVALGVAALVLDRWVAALAPDADAAVRAPLSARARWVVAGSALAGLAALVEEVAWTRVLALMLGASVYAFSLMLLAFLAGIALGGAIGGPLADRVHRRDGVRGVLLALASAQVGVALSSLLLMHLYQELPFAYVWLFELFRAELRPSALNLVGLAVAGLVMLPPAVLMGVSFPLSVRAAVGDDEAVGRSVGLVYAWNTAGGVVGAAVAGFVLLPWLKVTGTVQLAAAVHGLAAVAAWVALGSTRAAVLWSRRGRVLAALGVAALSVGVLWPPQWNPLLMTAGMHTYAADVDRPTRDAVEKFAIGRFELLFYEEGWSSVVTVAENPSSGNRWLANNGKIDASTHLDMPTQLLVSLLSLPYVQQTPKDVCVIGLASGITAGAMSLADDIERLDVVEIEPAIVRAAAYFERWNFGVLHDPRVNLLFDDGRNHLLRTPPATYDIIVSEPSNPWLTGVSNLFTEDFFRMGRERVKPGGVWAQWLQLYSMDDDDVRSLIGTFASVWPHVLVFAAAEDADIVLIGANHPIAPTWEAAESLLARDRVREALRSVEMDLPENLVATFLMDRDAALALAGDFVPNTDDNMRVEFRAPLHLHSKTQNLNAGLIGSHRFVPVEALRGDLDRIEAVAGGYRLREDDRSTEAWLRAALPLEANHPDRARRIEEAFELWLADHLDEPPSAAQRKALEAVFLREEVAPLLAVVQGNDD